MGFLEDPLRGCFGNQLGKPDTSSLSSTEQLANILPFPPRLPPLLCFGRTLNFSSDITGPEWGACLGGERFGDGGYRSQESPPFHAVYCDDRTLPLARPLSPKLLRAPASSVRVLTCTPCPPTGCLALPAGRAAAFFPGLFLGPRGGRGAQATGKIREQGPQGSYDI